MLGPVDPGAILNQAGSWIQSILTDRRNRRIAAAANIIYNAGVVVVKMRDLRDQIKHLLGPLRNFNPRDWSTDRRTSLIGDLQTFANRLPAFGVIDQHAATLQQLTAKPLDKVTALRDEIIQNATDVSQAGFQESADQMSMVSSADVQSRIEARASELSWHSAVDKYFHAGRNEEGSPTLINGPDLLVAYYLPALLWLVRNADANHPEQVKDLRILADGLLITRSDRDDQPLEELVRETEIAFGRLTGLLMENYPQLPKATWAELR
jgi:hypothetical protein